MELNPSEEWLNLTFLSGSRSPVRRHFRQDSELAISKMEIVHSYWSERSCLNWLHLVLELLIKEPREVFPVQHPSLRHISLTIAVRAVEGYRMECDRCGLSTRYKRKNAWAKKLEHRWQWRLRFFTISTSTVQQLVHFMIPCESDCIWRAFRSIQVDRLKWTLPWLLPNQWRKGR